MKSLLFCLFCLVAGLAIGAPVVSAEKPPKKDGWRMEETKRGYFQGLGYEVVRGEYVLEIVDCPPPPWLSLPVAEDQIVRLHGVGEDTAQKMPLSELRRGVMLTNGNSSGTSTETLVINSHDWWEARWRFLKANDSYRRNRMPDPPKVEHVWGKLPGGGRWLLVWCNDLRQGASFRLVIVEENDKDLRREQLVIWSKPNRGGEVMGIINREGSFTK